MKAYEVVGRVVSHSLFQPNPKDLPELELAKIVLTLSPATSDADKHTKAVLVVEKDAIFEDLILGRMLVLTVKEHPQQDLFLPSGRQRDVTPAAEGTATLEFTDPETGEITKAEFEPEQLAEVGRRAVERVNRGRRSKGNTH